MAARQILVLGGGFAGLWSALGAARKLAELGVGSDEVAVTLVNRDAYHGIRVRNYEADLSDVRVPLDGILAPVGVRRVEGEVEDLDPRAHEVDVRQTSSSELVSMRYDRVVFALGSQVVRPTLPGLEEHAFDVDTFVDAQRLGEHLAELPEHAPSEGQFKVVVVGAGLTGIETATGMVSRLRAVAAPLGAAHAAQVVLIDHSDHVGSDMGDYARPTIERALAEQGITCRTCVRVNEIREDGVTLDTGERIAAATVVWCAGMRASPLTAKLSTSRDRLGRVPVDAYLKVPSVPDVFAAGDSACAQMDPAHVSVMSCQHGRPMGRFAGHNVVCDLLGKPMLPLHINWYVTVLDLGAAGALYTEGWDRRLAAVGADAKRVKETINCKRIYPPRSGDRAEILAAAAPIVQGRPALH